MIRLALCTVGQMAHEVDPTKFFGCELGAQTSMADERYIVNGAHTQERLLELLDVFIVKFVLCGACDNPETELVITGKGKNEDIHKDCKACGRQTGVDMRHKLTTYILKNPPAKKGKKGKKGMTAEANVGGPMVMDAADEGADEGEDDATPDMGVPTSGTAIDDALGRGTDPILDNPDSAEDVAKKLKALAVNGDDDDEEDADSPYAALGAWLEDNQSATDADIIGQIKELGIVGKHKVLVEVGNHLFTEEVATEVTKRANLLQAVSLTLCITVYGLLADCRVVDDWRKTPKVLPWRSRTTARQLAQLGRPSCRRNHLQGPHGSVPGRRARRGSRQAVGYPRQQEVCRQGQVQKGQEERRRLPQGEHHSFFFVLKQRDQMLTLIVARGGR